MTTELFELGTNGEHLRTVFRLDLGGGESVVRLEDLCKGNRFRMEATDPSDQLYGATALFQATSEPSQDEQGTWSVLAVPVKVMEHLPRIGDVVDRIDFNHAWDFATFHLTGGRSFTALAWQERPPRTGPALAGHENLAKKAGTRTQALEAALLDAFNELPPMDVELSNEQVAVMDRISALLGLPDFTPKR